MLVLQQDPLIIWTFAEEEDFKIIYDWSKGLYNYCKEIFEGISIVYDNETGTITATSLVKSSENDIRFKITY